mgnify:CR=1 FL=1
MPMPFQSIEQEWRAGTPAPGWREVLRSAFATAELKNLIAFLDDERARGLVIYPPPQSIFRAFSLTDFSAVRVVILGQDPYHNPGQANGLAFSVGRGTPVPPSLLNIYKEIATDLGAVTDRSGQLEPWAAQGVFLLNTVLTVRDGAANSHRGKGWETITGRAVAALAERPEPLVFLLWGKNAGEHAPLVDNGRHLVLKCAHPSPMSADRGFFGCRHFSQANAFLERHGFTPMRW